MADGAGRAQTSSLIHRVLYKFQRTQTGFRYCRNAQNPNIKDPRMGSDSVATSKAHIKEPRQGSAIVKTQP